MVSEVLKACCDVLFRSDPGQTPGVSPTRPGTPFAIIRDFGENECMWASLGLPFRTLHLTKPGTNQDLRCIRDSIINKQGKEEPKKLEYKHLEGLPCILILVEKGRMGDTFPHSFNCLDLRIRTSENTSTFVQEIGRLCRYPGTINEKSFSSWSDVEEEMFRGGMDPFNGGRKMLAVSYLSAFKKFLGYATHKAPWDEERASGTVLFAGDQRDENFIVKKCHYIDIAGSTEIELNQAPDAQWGSLVDCRMTLKPGSTLTKGHGQCWHPRTRVS